jgi:hypothetical protein
MTSPNLAHAALDAAERGWPVFMLGRTKRPVANCPACRPAAAANGHDTAHDPDRCGCLTCHGFYAATTDPDRIRVMLTAVPRGLLAVRTGAASELVVADIDPRHGGRLDPVLMPPTLGVATGHDGWHLYYRHPGPHVTSRPLPGRPGVDIKADGGYVVLPPSIHPDTGRPYRWLSTVRPIAEMPPALAAAVSDPGPRPPALHQPDLDQPTTTPAPPGALALRSTVVPAGGGGISSPEALLAATVTTVRTAPQGRRRTTLYGAARGLARMVAAGALTRARAVAELTDAGRAAQQTDRDIHAAISGGFRDEGLHA